MEEQPQPTGAIFVIFLWLALMMLSMLIAVFCNTFDALKSKVNERLVFRRAMYCVTIEKLFPLWYHQHRRWGRNGCNMGKQLGIIPRKCMRTSLDEVGLDEVGIDSELGLFGRMSVNLKRAVGDYGTMIPSSPTVSKTETSFTEEILDRWWLWSKDERTCETWRMPVGKTDSGKRA